jgi:tetratricopeptide (TPR) repeat protein
MGDYDKAIADYTRLIEISPRLALAYYNRGYAYYKKGENAKAEADFKKARDLAYMVAP